MISHKQLPVVILMHLVNFFFLWLTVINVSLGAFILGNAHLRDVKTHLKNDLTVYPRSVSVSAILSTPE